MGHLLRTGLLIFLVCLPACIKKNREPKSIPFLEVSLYTGIPGIGKLGDSYVTVVSSTRYGFKRVPIEPDSELAKLGVNEYLQFRELGTRLYLKRDGVAMITTQEPFNGVIKGKRVNLFAFSVPPISNWESHLVKELGSPEARASGGRFGSEALFYNWGDISYNRMGPNEIALYRNSDIANYRLRNFGRQLQLFPQK